MPKMINFSADPKNMLLFDAQTIIRMEYDREHPQHLWMEDAGGCSVKIETPKNIEDLGRELASAGNAMLEVPIVNEIGENFSVFISPLHVRRMSVSSDLRVKFFLNKGVYSGDIRRTIWSSVSKEFVQEASAVFDALKGRFAVLEEIDFAGDTIELVRKHSIDYVAITGLVGIMANHLSPRQIELHYGDGGRMFLYVPECSHQSAYKEILAQHPEWDPHTNEISPEISRNIDGMIWDRRHEIDAATRDAVIDKLVQAAGKDLIPIQGGLAPAYLNPSYIRKLTTQTDEERGVSEINGLLGRLGVSSFKDTRDISVYFATAAARDKALDKAFGLRMQDNKATAARARKVLRKSAPSKNAKRR